MVPRAVLLLLSAVVVALVTSDFTTIDHGFEFIYHSQHDLLLVIHANKCYYTYVSVTGEPTVHLSTYWQHTQTYVEKLIRENAPVVHPSTLAHVQEMFGDHQADASCVDKAVFLIQLSFVDVCHISSHAAVVAEGCPGSVGHIGK